MSKRSMSFLGLASPSDIIYFFETCQTLNFSRASERLGISQPTLSQAIQRVEHGVGEELFVRHKRGVTLTPAGKQLMQHARVLLQAWEQLRLNAGSAMNEVKGEYSIGCHVSVAMYSLKTFLPELLSTTDLEIKLVHDLSRRITERVISSEIDIGIVVNPVRHRDLVLQKLCQDEVCFWEPTKKVLKQSSDSLEVSTIIYDPNIMQSQNLLNKAQKQGIVFTKKIETASLEVVAELTSSGCGVGILPTRVAELCHPKITKFAGSPTYQDDIYVIFRAENRKVASIQKIVKDIKKGMSQ